MTEKDLQADQDRPDELSVSGPEFTVARVFDFADPDTGPGFDPSHEVIDDPGERAGLLDYLSLW